MERGTDPAAGASTARANRARAGLARAAAAVADGALGGVGSALDRVNAALADAARVTKFLRGRLAFECWPGDVFVSSYPRSGTTWTQLMLYLLTRRDRSLAFEHLSQVSPWWERSLAWGNASAADFGRMDRPRIFKSHLPHAWLPRGARYVYVHRQGHDVAVSYYHLYCSHLGYRGSFAEFFERFVRGDLQYGAWASHVAGWERRRHDPRVLLLCYEDMKRAPGACVRTLAAFLGLEVTGADVDEIARLSSFESMKAREEQFDHLGELRLARGIHKGMFIRRGEVGQGLAYLSAAQRERLASARRHSLERSEIEWRLPDFLH